MEVSIGKQLENGGRILKIQIHRFMTEWKVGYCKYYSFRDHNGGPASERSIYVTVVALVGCWNYEGYGLEILIHF